MRYSLSCLLILAVSGCGNVLTKKEEIELTSRMEKAEEGVANYIRKYAIYPESYEPISYSEYSESFSLIHDKKVSESEKYVINHVHKILDKDSVMTTFKGYFIMEHDYYVSLIEKNRSNAMGGGFPPDTKVWMERFGRALNAQDSIELNRRGKYEVKKIVKELKEGFEEGNTYTEDPNDMKELLQLIDTLDAN